MKLTQFEIFDYQSIRSSNPVNVSDITCLVGKNEAGKTALLRALYRLNPIVEEDGSYDIMDDFPRAELATYEYEVEQGTRKPATVARAIFALEEADLEPVHEEFGREVFNDDTLTISKGYDNNRSFYLDVNVDAAFKAFVKNVDVPMEIKNNFYECFNFGDLSEVIQQHSFHEQLKSLAEEIRQIHEQGLDRYIYLTYLRPRLPKFVYFDQYYQLRGHENLDALKQRFENNNLKPSDHAMLGLLSMAGLDIDHLLNPRRTQLLINQLEGAGLAISKQIFPYWSQNQSLQVKFDVRPAHPEDPGGDAGGSIMWASVFDPYRSHSTLLGARSRGFVWFFSFLAWYSQLRDLEAPVILLLDEPALSLHPRAQIDLLRYFEEKLRPHHQLIYSTHSPFMIDPHHPERLRFVEDRTAEQGSTSAANEHGTKVIEDPEQVSPESLAPVQMLDTETAPAQFSAATPSAAPLLGQLLVDDVTDLFYLRAMSLLLAELGLGLEPNWIVVPVGGIDQVPTYLNQIRQMETGPIALLVNTSQHDREVLNAFLAKQLLPAECVRTYSDFAAIQEAGIEDLFDVVFFTNLVNAAYRAYLTQPISAPNLSASTSIRLRDRVAEYLTRNPLQEGMSFNTRRPARLFADNTRKLESEISQQAKDRFSALFRWLNELGNDEERSQSAA